MSANLTRGSATPLGVSQTHAPCISCRPHHAATFIRQIKSIRDGSFANCTQSAVQPNVSQLQQPDAAAAPPANKTCFDKYPWISAALDTHFAPTWAAANVSKQTAAEALQAIRNLKPQYGLEEVILMYDPSIKKIAIGYQEVRR